VAGGDGTMSDVAGRALVSTATVSRVLSGDTRVAPATRERVLRAVRELDYRPNAVARSLRAQRTQTLGLVISDVLNPFFTELARAVDDTARALGFAVVLGNADDDPEREDAFSSLLLDRRVDGLLITPAASASPAVARAGALGVPIVFIDRAAPGAPVVRADGAAAIDELVGHLRALGHDRIAIVAGPSHVATGRERLDAFASAMAVRGVPLPRTRIEAGDFSIASGEAATLRLMSASPSPTALFVADNLMTLGALRALRHLGIRPGSGIALASFDDVPWFEVFEPPITAIAQPVAAIGAAAVRALVARIAGEPIASATYPCRLVIRASCGEPAITSLPNQLEKQ